MNHLLGFICRAGMMRVEAPMAKNIFRSGKQTRPKTAVKGKRYHLRPSAVDEARNL